MKWEGTDFKCGGRAPLAPCWQPPCMWANARLNTPSNESCRFTLKLQIRLLPHKRICALCLATFRPNCALYSTAPILRYLLMMFVDPSHMRSCWKLRAFAWRLSVTCVYIGCTRCVDHNWSGCFKCCWRFSEIL